MNRKLRRMLVAAGAMVGAGAAVAVWRRPDRFSPAHHDGGYVTCRAVTVDRPVDATWEMICDPGRLSVALDQPVTAQDMGDGRWRVLAAPFGGTAHPIEVIVQAAGRSAHWRIESGPRAHDGRLKLVPAPGDRGTELQVELTYPQGRLRHRVDTVRGHDPDQRLRTVLRRIKSVIESGQVVSTMNEPSGRTGATERLTRVVRAKLATGGRP